MYNGVGPWWVSQKVRGVITSWFTSYFDEASAIKHDEGYSKADPPRIVCDAWYLYYMTQDCKKQHGAKVYTTYLKAYALYVAVRCFGWLSYGRDKRNNLSK